MDNEQSQYYITQAPTITELNVSSNIVGVTEKVKIDMKITQTPRFLFPETYYPSEIYSGEVVS